MDDGERKDALVYRTVFHGQLREELVLQTVLSLTQVLLRRLPARVSLLLSVHYLNMYVYIHARLSESHVKYMKNAVLLWCYLSAGTRSNKKEPANLNV